MNGHGQSEKQENPRETDTRAGIGWLLLDMTLVAGGMTALVKAQGVTYPAFQLVCWGDDSPEKAMDMAMGRAFGRA